MANEYVKNYARIKGVKLWQIASAIQMQDSNFSRKLRVELSSEEKQKIKEIIDELSTADTKTHVLSDCFNEMNEQEKKMLIAYAEQILLRRKESEGEQCST